MCDRYFYRITCKRLQEKSIGVILSCSGSNGTKGITSIKEAGGNVIVQALSSSEFRHMPESAIKTGCVDDIALPEEMPAIIEKYVQKRYKAGA